MLPLEGPVDSLRPVFYLVGDQEGPWVVVVLQSQSLRGLFAWRATPWVEVVRLSGQPAPLHLAGPLAQVDLEIHWVQQALCRHLADP